MNIMWPTILQLNDKDLLRCYIILLTTFYYTDVPEQPGRPTASDYNDKSITIKWTPPKSDGGDSIKKYIIQRKTLHHDKWKEVGGNKGTSVSQKMTVKKGSTHKFRVIAENTAGKGSPSEESENYTACGEFDITMMTLLS